ncbi:A/G-specific adenine glycosylase [Methylicorpusculum oleiharenae]|uniref:A/G-specific adenine glycosylase n=1 Tax=Methylicorpusculum oleiharenae TaxID=1338687 RepID=UPI0013581B9D|nr:A/G-specific adenine glycosylase [Methylicorpusculum oleiharenae]MCD2449702.1 A/G-specific adenine glycosylase [Methylicorpusculum oleiharenae]
MMRVEASVFQRKLLDWFDLNGRKDLPWQQPVTAYRVWLSETMLQQTQVSTVIPYFLKFVDRFPEVDDLASASLDSVLQMWSGLGYYARARNLHQSARIIQASGRFPDNFDSLIQLPGIGQSTAGAILSIAFQNSHPILDGNVKRVLARFEGVSGWPGTSVTAKQLWTVSAYYTPKERVADYTQAIMDLGATVCTRSKPDCVRCPLHTDCYARLNGTVALLPAPKPAKKLPVKHLYFLYLTDGSGHTLLEQRPLSGIWGGLWSFPEFESVTAAHKWCLCQQISIIKSECLPEQRHTFSHFHLNYIPLRITTDNHKHFVMEANRLVWYKNPQIKLLGLAAPIQRLLESTHEDTA